MASRSGGSGLLTTAAVVAVAGITGIAAADHARAQAEGRESGVQAALRWFTEDVLGVPADDGGAGSSRVPRRRPSRGLTRAELDVLPTRIYRRADAERAAQATARGDSPDASHDDKQMCAICQDHFVPEDELTRLPCFHEYHVDCITSFLSSASQPMCPCCRHPVTFG